MKKFFVLFAIPVATMDEWRKQTDSAKMKEVSQDMMHKWQTWMEQHGAMFVEKGSPLGKTKRAKAEGVADARNDLNWWAIVQGESQQAVADTFKDHPQLQIPTAYIEIMEMKGPEM